MAIINSYNKKRGVTYVYDSFSYWDKELKQPRSKRKLLGRRDPDTGELVPTGRRKPPAAASAHADSDTDYAALYNRSQEAIRKKDAMILRLRGELAEARRRLLKKSRGIARAMKTLEGLDSPGERNDA
ncbi:MAG: hypothetical protein BWX73_01022 [Lentisphaerae bacterium ADurb.Bin082]|nr:MAG: hypothetical protein BWX73_01022 [Lentisphaerae bacterium ADurb.Bin082]